MQTGPTTEELSNSQLYVTEDAFNFAVKILTDEFNELARALNT